MSDQATNPRAAFPDKLRFLFEPHRYKICHGGRGGAKSWSVARALLIKGAEKPLRILCAREFQNSIKDSVHKLLSDQIASLGLSSFYEVQLTSIKGANGTEFAFEGLRHNVTKIKSFEGADIAWVEEAQTVSKASWETLIPTIRKEDSEIWVTFNPELETDETYQRFVIRPPSSAIVVRVNFDDNPWFPDVLRREAEELKLRDIAAYDNIWRGLCRKAVEGAIYAAELRAAEEDDRICRVPYDAMQKVHTFWDLGRADMTSIWFCQQVGFEYRFIDYYENSGFALGHYLKVLQDRPYLYGDDWMPHDAQNKQLGAVRTIEEQAQAVGRKVRIVPKTTVPIGIEAGRAIFNRCWFDRDKCSDGLQALRHYQYEVDPVTGQRSTAPLHNWASHGADAYRYFAVGMRDARPARKPGERPALGAQGWAG